MIENIEQVTESEPMTVEVSALTVGLTRSYIRVAAKNHKAFASVEACILQTLAFGVEELTRREERLAVQHAKDAYFKEKGELDRMFATLKDSKSPITFEDYVNRLRKIEATHGLGFTRA